MFEQPFETKQPHDFRKFTATLSHISQIFAAVEPNQVLAAVASHRSREF